MASVDASGAWSVHRTLTSNTVDTVTFGSDLSAVEVLNRNGVGEIYFTVDGSPPTVGGDSTHVLPAAIGSVTVNAGQTSVPTVVRLISSAAVAYSVRSA